MTTLHAAASEHDKDKHDKRCNHHHGRTLLRINERRKTWRSFMKYLLKQCAVRAVHHFKPLKFAAHKSLPPWTGRLLRSILPLCVIFICAGCSTNRHISFLGPQGVIAAAEREHFLGVLVILAILVALPIFLLTPWLMWRYRYRAKPHRYDPEWKANLPLEIMTWAGPIVIVIALGFFVWRHAHELDPFQPINPNAQALQMQVIGYDWKWLFVYPKQGIASVGVMAVPIGKPVAMHLTSATVMQSLHIPALGSQIYAMGGMITQLHLMATKPGRSLGENNMYNGKGFHQQRFTVVAMSPPAFKKWVAKVRRIGVPLNAETYKILSKRSTVSKLVKSLPNAAHDGNVYLTHVRATLFPAVIEATRTDNKDELNHVLATTAQPSATLSRNSTTSSTEKMP